MIDGALARPRRAAGTRDARRLLWGLAGAAIGAATLVPLGAVLVRAAGVDAEVWSRVASSRLPGLVARTAALVATSTGLAVALGLPLAWLVARTDLPGRRVVKWLAVLPLAIPPYVGALAYIALFGPGGLVTSSGAIFGLLGATLGIGLFTYPYVFALAADAFSRMDPSQEEAARSMGAGAIRTFLRVTLPGARPAIVGGSLLVALYALSDFGSVSLMRYDSFTRIIYFQLTARFDRSAAAALSAILAVVAILLVALERRSRSRARYAQAGAGRAARPIALGPWRIPALAFTALALVASLGAPLGVLGAWTARGIAEGGASALGGHALNSLAASAAAATIATIVGLVVAFRAARRRALGRATLVAAHAGYAMPGVVVAFGVVSVALGTPLYATVGIVVAAYVVRFLPQAANASHGALLQVSPSVEESARSLGERPAGVLRRVTLPLIAGGLGTGWALVFLSSMKELPATLLLRPAGFDTLAVRIWSLASEGFYERAAPAALLLITASIPALVLALRGGSAGRAIDGLRDGEGSPG